MRIIGNVLNIFFFRLLISSLVGFWWNNRKSCFLNFDFRVAVSFLISFVDKVSVLLKISMILALVL